MANILFITYDYPPILSPESIQVQRRAIALANNNNKIYILSVHEKPKFEFIDSSLIKEHKNIKIIHTKAPFFEKLLNIFFKLIDLTDRKLWWKNIALKQAKLIINDNDIDVLYTHSTPLVNHLVGLEIKEKFKNLKWVAHMSDPWTLNPYTTYKFKWQFKLNRFMEKKVLEKAVILTLTSKKTKQLFVKEFSFLNSKIVVLPHTYDESLFSDKDNKDTMTTIVHTGNIYGLRTIKYLLVALSEIKEDLQIKFKFYGKIKKSELKLIKQYNLESIIEVYEQIPYLKSLYEMSQADFLLLVDAPIDNSFFFPSKLADYIGVSKPIIALTPNNSSTRDILNHINNNDFIAPSDSSNDIKVVLNKIKSYKGINLKHQDFYSMNNFDKLRSVFEK